METNKLDKEFIQNLSKRKFFYSFVLFLIMLSGFFLFNQISYMSEDFINNGNQINANVDVKNKDLKKVSCIFHFVK